MANWYLFHGNGKRQEKIQEKLLVIAPPPWRNFGYETDIFVDKNGEEKR